MRRAPIVAVLAALPIPLLAQGPFDVPPFASAQLGVVDTIYYKSDLAAFGRDPSGQVRIFHPDSRSAAPVVIYADTVDNVDIANGLLRAGYAVAVISQRSRRRPGTMYRNDAALIARGVDFIFDNAARYRIQPRFVMIGSGWSSGLVGLLSTDPQLLGDAVFSHLKRAIIANPMYLDGPTEFLTGTTRERIWFKKSFGSADADWRRNTAVDHLSAPNAAAFLIFADDEARDETKQSLQSIVSRLEREGSSVALIRERDELPGEQVQKSRLRHTLDFVEARIPL